MSTPHDPDEPTEDPRGGAAPVPGREPSPSATPPAYSSPDEPPRSTIRTGAVIGGFFVGLAATALVFPVSVMVATGSAVAVGIVLALPLLLAFGLLFAPRARGIATGMLISCGALWLLLIGPCLAAIGGL